MMGWRARLYGASTTQPAGTFAGAGTRRAVLIVTCGSSICPTITPSPAVGEIGALKRSEEHTSELQSLMRISYAVFCLKKKNHNKNRDKAPTTNYTHTH